MFLLLLAEVDIILQKKWCENNTIKSLCFNSSKIVLHCEQKL